MKDKSYKRFFTTLANTNRLAIIHYLISNNDARVSDIVEATGLEQTLVSHNLKRLLECSFVDVTDKGRSRNYKVNVDTIQPLLQLIDRHVELYCCKCEQK